MAFWLLMILLVAAAVLVAAVTFPVRFRLRWQSATQSRLRIDVYAFGGLGPAIPVLDTARKTKEPSQPKKKKRAAHPSKSVSRLFDRNTVRLVLALLEKFKFAWIRGEAELGLADPADTGAVYGALAPLMYAGKYAKGSEFVIRPNFDHPVVAGKIDAAVDLIPIKLAPPVLWFGWTNLRSEKWS